MEARAWGQLTVIITLGIVLFLVGSFIASQDTKSKFSAPLMVAGLVLIVVKLIV